MRTFYILEHGIKHQFVILCLFLYSQWIGSTAAWHPIETQGAIFEGELHIASHLRSFRDMIMLGEDLGSQLSGCQHRLAFGQGSQHPIQVGRLHD